MPKKNRKENRHRPKQKQDRALALKHAGVCDPDTAGDYDIVDQAEIDELFADFMTSKK